MNGRAAKRIRLAALACGAPVKRLKREYRALPYHQRPKVRRPPNGVAITHGDVLRALHAFDVGRLR